MIRKFVFFALILSLHFLAVACGGCKAPSSGAPLKNIHKNREPLKIGVAKGDILSLPAYVINENSMAQPLGLKIGEPVVFQTDDALLNALSEGKIHGAVVDPIMAMARAEKPGGILCSVARRGCSLVIHAGEVAKPLELVGMGLAVPRKDSFSAFYLHRFLVSHKLDGRVYVLTLPRQKMAKNHYERYINGFVTCEPLISTAIVRENTGILAGSENFLPDHPSRVLIAGHNILNKRINPVRKYTKALDAACEWINNNSQSSAEIASRRLNIDKDVAAGALDRVAFSTKIAKRHLIEYANYLNDLGLTSMDDSSLFTNDYIAFDDPSSVGKSLSQ